MERHGIAHSFRVDGTTAAQLIPIMRANIAKETGIITMRPVNIPLSQKTLPATTTSPTEPEITDADKSTNTVEGFYSIFKRGMTGIYQDCGERHLHRHLAEFDSRYSNRVKFGVDDAEGVERALKGIIGKRSTY